MKTIVFVSGVSGVGKTSICNYIKNNILLKEYTVFDIDDLENVNNYNDNTYALFYENAIKKAVQKSGDKNIIIGSCINPHDINNINLLNNLEVKMILITCSNEELTRRLKSRDIERNCSSDEFINSQIEYQNYLIEYKNDYQLHIDNTNKTIDSIGSEIEKFLKI